MRRPYSQAIQYPSCRSKNRYPTRALAEAAREKRQIKYGWLFRIYACDSCDQFHFATVKRNGRRVPYIHLGESDEQT